VTSGRADPQVVLRRLSTVEQATSHLRRHAGTSAEALGADLDRQWAVLHGLQIAIQGTLDIAAHIAAAEGQDVRDYTSAIDALGRLGVLDATFAKRLRGVAGFRNVLVHEYLDVDLTVVAAVLEHGLDDLDAFVQAVRGWLSRAG
jgi:uncharacterized protein YutE (UPF0331/DUF86 family)